MTNAATAEAQQWSMNASRGFVEWLANQQASLALSTYQTGKLFLVGYNDNGQFSVYERNFERAMKSG